MEDKKQLQSNIILGQKLTRLEMLWDTKFDQGKPIEKQLKKEIESLFQKSGYKLNDSTYPNFIQNIFNIYNNTGNLIGYVGILIGRCIGQIIIFKNIKEDDSNYDQTHQLIASNINNIPDKVVINKELLLDYLIEKYSANDISIKLENEVFEYIYNNHFIKKQN
jgi:hypothetical protein